MLKKQKKRKIFLLFTCKERSNMMKIGTELKFTFLMGKSTFDLYLLLVLQVFHPR